MMVRVEQLLAEARAGLERMTPALAFEAMHAGDIVGKIVFTT